MVNLNQTRTKKEEAIERMRANLPPDMLKYNNFVCFSLEPDTTSHSGYNKIPKNSHAYNNAKNNNESDNAKSNDPTTWGSFDEAARAWIKSSTLHGIGFMFGNSPFFGVDIDDQGDKLNSGDFDGADMVQALHTYTEYSPSGTGLHCICIGELPPKDRKHGKFEMYSDGRFFTMTGNVYANPRTISDCTESIKPYHEKYIVIPKREEKEAKKKAKEAKKPTQTPRPAAVGTLAEDEIISKALKAANGSTFKALYFGGDTSAYGGDDSAADMALCNLLAFWTGKNAGTMDALFRKSALYRPKWDEKRGTETYGEITINEAINFCDRCYEGGSAPRFIIKNSAADQSENAADIPEPPPNIESLTKEDYIKETAIYDYIESFLNYSTGDIDEFSLECYITELADHSKAFQCKDVFSKRMKARVKELKSTAKGVKRLITAERTKEAAAGLPNWIIPSNFGNKVNEVSFCNAYLEEHGEIKCINGVFYDIDGILSLDKLEHDICDKITPHIVTNVAKTARKVSDCMALQYYSPPIKPQTDRIHVKNGTLIYKIETAKDSEGNPVIDENGNEMTVGKFVFSPYKEFCTCRLDVEYHDTIRRADKWQSFLDDLFETTDQRTIQEYIGYCMIPTTKAQAALFVKSPGGEGKGVLGAIIKEIFGHAMVAGSVNDLDNGPKARFARSKLVGKYIMYDDDIQLSALTDTGFFKELITAKQESEIEEKYKPTYEALLYARIIAFGNGTLSSLHDNSNGFWRRQLILSAKPQNRSNNEINRSLDDELKEEKDKIFIWALHGLERLIKNKWEFTVSDQTRKNVEQAKRDSNNIIAFLESDDIVIDGARNRRITSADLYTKYHNWCVDNLETPRKENSFKRTINEIAHRYHIEQSTNIPKPNGGHARGYIGIGEISPITT